MVSIVTGKINSGKTTRIYSYYLENPVGDGFISLKVMDKDLVARYDLLRLSSNQEIPFIIHERLLCEEQVRDRIGPYRFLEGALSAAEAAIDEMISQGIQPLYLDEIGSLELNGQGFSTVLKKMVSSGFDLVLSIREDLIEQVVKQFGIKEWKIIH